MPTKDPEKKRAAQARYRAKNRDKITDQIRWIKILNKYGLTQGQWSALEEKQGGKCAICPRTEPGGRGQWHVDHDHVTGRVRGLLCCWCNRALGLMGDDVEILAAAAEYLESHRASTPKDEGSMGT